MLAWNLKWLKFNFFDLFNYFAETVGQSNHAAIKPAHNREVDEKNLPCFRPLCDQLNRKLTLKEARFLTLN